MQYGAPTPREGVYLTEARFKALTEALPALVFIADAHGNTIFTNEKVGAWSGLPREATLGHGWLQMVHPDDRARAAERWQQALQTGCAYDAEVRFRRRDGEYRRHACRAEPVRDENGRIVEWFGACMDVEEYRRADAAARERAEDLQTLMDTLPVGVLIAHDPECRRMSGNRAAARMLHMPPGANLSKSAPPGERPTVFRILKNGHEVPPEALPVQRAARGEIIESEELDHAFEDGTLVHTLLSAHPLYDSQGRPRGAIATILDITHLKSIQAADQRKAEFLAELGHELRNPLAPLLTGVELLRRAPSDPSLLASVLATMQRQLEHLVGIVDDLLDVARVSQGEVVLNRAPLDLRDVLELGAEIARPLIAERRHRLIIEQAAAPLTISADEKRLVQVVSNLLSNAAKYTEPGGVIRAWTEQVGGEAVLHVRDTGIGIPPDQLGVIFRMFARVPQHRERVTGLGIGLALARRIVGLHGGSIAAHSDGPGHGSEFIVRLPLAEAPAKKETSTVSSANERTRRRVLVVDDNVDAAEMLRLWLEIEGHEARAVHDGPAALDALHSFSPEVVLLDIGLRPMDGYEIARRMRAVRGRDILLIAVTGWGQEEDRRRAIEAGFDAHLTKPASDAQLRALLAGDRGPGAMLPRHDGAAS